MNWPGAGRRAERAEAEASATVVADEIRERARRIGDILRQSRVDRGVTLADVEQDIRINRVYIEALENARFEELPAPVYARGFMRSYARYLGLDPDEALRAVPRDLPRPRDLDPMPGLRRAMPSTLPAMPRLNPPMAIGIGAAVVLLVVALIFVPRLGGSTGITSTPTPTASATVAVNIAAPNLVGMKVSDTPLSAVEPYLLDGLDIFVGSEALLPELPRAAGTVTGLGAVYPEVVAALVRNPSGPALERAGALRALLVKRFAASAKVALALRGLPIRPDVRAPLRPLDAAERAALERALDAVGG